MITILKAIVVDRQENKKTKKNLTRYVGWSFSSMEQYQYCAVKIMEFEQTTIDFEFIDQTASPL